MVTFGVGSRPWAGLDLGTHSVKLVSLPPGANRGRHAEVSLPGALMSDEAPSASTLAGLIAECMHKLGTTPRSFQGITIGVSGPDVIVKQIALPWMDDSEVAGALRFEARKHLPFDPQTLVLDHQVLSRNSSEKKLEVLLACVSHQRLERTLAPLRELGVEAAIVDAAPLALSNALTQTLPRDVAGDADAHVLVDLGHRGSWLTLRPKGLPFFARQLDWGGQALLRSMAAELPGGIEEAAAWLHAPEASLSQDHPAARAGREAVLRLADDVRRSLAFYGTQASLPEDLLVHVSGGCVRLPGLVEQFEAGLGKRTRRFGALEVGARQSQREPQFTQALGLAMRSE
jgi:type IV pilus assembly protein PilM